MKKTKVAPLDCLRSVVRYGVRTDYEERQAGCVTKVSLSRLFCEWFKIALFVVGGGYAIIVVADEVFGRRLKWVGEGELLEHLPIISSIPGLIAGNSAIYVGLKTHGRLGAVVALAGVALPSILIFLCVSVGFDSLPKNVMLVDGAFFGLRSALSGVIAGTIWRTLFKSRADWSKGMGVEVSPLSWKERLVGFAAFAVAIVLAAAFARESLVPEVRMHCDRRGIPACAVLFPCFCRAECCDAADGTGGLLESHGSYADDSRAGKPQRRDIFRIQNERSGRFNSRVGRLVDSVLFHAFSGVGRNSPFAQESFGPLVSAASQAGVCDIDGHCALEILFTEHF